MTESAIIFVAFFAMIAICSAARAWSEREPRPIVRKCECKCSSEDSPTTEKRL